MISHLKVRPAKTDLRQYIAKINETLSGRMCEKILIKLRKLNALSSLLSLWYK